MSKKKNRPKKKTLEFFKSPLKKGPSLGFASFYACLALVAITWLVFGQTLQHDFVDFDDNVYVYQNPVITRGLSVDGVLTAFTHPHARNWHPLTTISHMLDCQLFGLKARGHHFTNVLLHTIAVLLLLDYWPLKRFSEKRTRLVLEKIPLLALSAPSCIATLLAQHYAKGSMDQLPFTWRLNNAAVSYVAYIWQMLW